MMHKEYEKSCLKYLPEAKKKNIWKKVLFVTAIPNNEPTIKLWCKEP